MHLELIDPKNVPDMGRSLLVKHSAEHLDLAASVVGRLLVTGMMSVLTVTCFVAVCLAAGSGSILATLVTLLIFLVSVFGWGRSLRNVQPLTTQLIEGRDPRKYLPDNSSLELAEFEGATAEAINDWNARAAEWNETIDGVKEADISPDLIRTGHLLLNQRGRILKGIGEMRRLKARNEEFLALAESCEPPE